MVVWKNQLRMQVVIKWSGNINSNNKSNINNDIASAACKLVLLDKVDGRQRITKSIHKAKKKILPM